MLICSQLVSFPGSTALNTMWLLSGLQTLKGNCLNNEKKIAYAEDLIRTALDFGKFSKKFRFLMLTDWQLLLRGLSISVTAKYFLAART